MRKHRLIDRHSREVRYSSGAINKWMVMFFGLDYYINENLYFIDNVYVTFFPGTGPFLIACDEVTPYIYK